MIVYRDLLSNDELFTDSCKMREVDDSVFIEVEGKHTTECTKVDDSMIGGNKSAESYEEESADASTSGVDIVLQNRLAWVDMDKKKYQKYIKAYVAKLVEKLTETKPDYVATFKKKAIPAVKRILDNFEEWDFYRGETDFEGANGMLCILGYREDQTTPYLLFFKDGLLEEKV